MLEIEKLAKMNRDLAKVNQELEESRLLAVSDQARTATRLLLVSGQLEHTEQKLYALTKELDDGQKDADLLRIERLKRAALQEQEDANRLKIEALQDELQEVQQSERMLHQRYIMIQSKYETLVKRHDNLKRQQQELELARESKEALAWLKETTDRLYSPPTGSMAQQGGNHNIHPSRSSHGSAPISIHQHSPSSSSSSSPPYPSSYIDPPLAAQNQLISLIKELATTNSTLRSELNEYRDLLQDSRNEVLALRSQVEDYEQGHAFGTCCAGRMDDASESYLTSQSGWSVMDVSLAGLDAVSHIGTLGSIPGSPPPYMTTPTSHHRRQRPQHHHGHHRHHLATGIRGNVFGELESFYSQTNGGQNSTTRPSGAKRTRQPSVLSRRRDSSTPSLADTIPSDPRHLPGASAVPTTTALNARPMSIPSHANPSPLMFGEGESNPESRRMSPQFKQDVEDVSSSTLLETTMDHHLDDFHTHASPIGAVVSLADEMKLVQASENTPQGSLATSTVLPPPSPDDAEISRSKHSSMEGLSLTTTLNRVELNAGDTSTTTFSSSSLKNRASSISLLSAELQKATRIDSHIDLTGDEALALKHQKAALRKLEGLPVEEHDLEVEGSSGAEPEVRAMNTAIESRPLQQHEKSFSDQGLTSWNQRRRLSEPLHHLAVQDSTYVKKSRPGSIYSLRRPRHRIDSSDFHCFHSGHFASASLGGLPDLQRCRSAEIVEQIMSERRNRVMEAWREGVVAASVTQQQSIHSIVAHGDQRKDADNVSIRSKVSKMSRMSRTSRMSRRRHRHGHGGHRKHDKDGKVSSGEHDSDGKARGLVGAHLVSTMEASMDAHRSRPSGLLATMNDDIVAEESEEHYADNDDNDDGIDEGKDMEKQWAMKLTDQKPLATPTLSIDTSAAATGAIAAATTTPVLDEPGSQATTPTATLRRGFKTPKGKKRQSLLSPMSSRSPLTRSPMDRSSLQMRDRRFPSEASTASEAFSNRRHDQEHSPYQLLHTLSTELMERLARSDTREMNRRLKRTFDIQALSQMSNSVIENVLTDVSNLGERFRWVEARAMDDMFVASDDDWSKPQIPQSRSKLNVVREAPGYEDVSGAGAGTGTGAGSGSGSESNSGSNSGSDTGSDSGSDEDGVDWDFSVEEFFPLAHVVQEMLSEIGKLRMTINELQLSYVQKVEQDRIRAEKDFMDTYGSDADEARYEGDDDLGPLERIEQVVPEKPTQRKNVLGMLDRPKILGTASTGMSGFFNKVFGGNNSSNNGQGSGSSGGGYVNVAGNQNESSINNRLNNDEAAFDADISPGPSVSENPKDKPSMAKSKSGIVVAETSHVFAESTWFSSPGQVDQRKAPKTPARSTIQEKFNTIGSIGGSFAAGPRLSATTSLAAMATHVSPSRSNTVPVPEKRNTSPVTSRTRAMDISFSPTAHDARSPPVSPTANSAHGLFSRSLPKNQFFGVFSSKMGAKADTVASIEPETGAGAGAGAEGGTGSSKEGEGVEASLTTTALKPPRSIGLSTRVSGPALNVLTKEDVFPEMWTTSTASSLSASLTTMPNTVIRERRATSACNGGGGSGESVRSAKTDKAASSSSAASATYSATGIEPAFSSIQSQPSTMSTSTATAASKPTLITRTSLTVATPSTSTVSSSPMSATSWFDSNRASGGSMGADVVSATHPHGTEYQESSRTTGVATSTGGYGPPVTSRPTIVAATTSAIVSTATTSTSTLGTLVTTTATLTTSKGKEVTSFHSVAAPGGSNNGSLTRSLGRASGRASALAFLRREIPASAVLGSIFQTQPSTDQQPSASQIQDQTERPPLSLAEASVKAHLHSRKNTAEHLLEQNETPGREVPGREYDHVNVNDKDNHGQALKSGASSIISGDSSRQDGANITEAMAEATIDNESLTRASFGGSMTASRSEVTLHSTLTTGLSQRDPVGSTAVAYVVAVPSSHQADEKEQRRKRAVFDRDLIKASQKRILAGVAMSQHDKTPFVPVSSARSSSSGAAMAGTDSDAGRNSESTLASSKPGRRGRALSVDSHQSTEPLKQSEIMDFWRVGAGVSRDLWNGFIKKVDGGRNNSGGA
ncbi:hypothetical protein BGZ94_005646 [Podila epigama]|nr:hypothetical protein BGZ94_005646 [Podila epigama]